MSLFQSTRPMRGATWETCAYTARYVIFQSTRPMRGATLIADLLDVLYDNFNPRAPCGARPRPWRSQCSAEYFNPRAPCGARRILKWRMTLKDEFQSTRPMRGATRCLVLRHRKEGISIHAPHAGRDFLDLEPSFHISISIHAPHAGRDRSAMGKRSLKEKFQSTRPMRGATV